MQIPTIAELRPGVWDILFLMFLLYLLIAGQAGPLGLMKVFTPVEWKPTPRDPEAGEMVPEAGERGSI